MSIAKKLLRGPGWFIIGMTALWTTPFLCHDLLKYSPIEYASSYLLYIILFGSAMIGMIALNALQSHTGFWSRPGILGLWLKIIAACIGYCLTTAVGFSVILEVSSSGKLDYFGTCPDGSIGMLILPSAFAYCVLGIALGCIYSLVILLGNMFRKHSH